MPLIWKGPLPSSPLLFLLYSTLLYRTASSFAVFSPPSLSSSSSLEGALLGTTMDSSADAEKTNPSRMNGKSIKAIIFDMDGTLLDTESLADKAILQALFGGGSKNNDCNDKDKDDFSCLPESIRSKSPYTEWRLEWELKKKILGLRGKEWSPITLNFFRQQEPCEEHEQLPTVEKLIDLWEQNLNAMCTEIEACAGAKALIGAIVSSSSSNCGSTKLPMAIATSSRMSGVAKKRTRHERDFFEHIDVIVTGDDPSVKNGKPAPDIYIEAARRLGVDPTECLVFEDALSGVKSGKAAGCQVVAVPDPRFSDEERERVFRNDGRADVVLTSLWEFDGRPFGMDFDMKEVSKLLQQE